MTFVRPQNGFATTARAAVLAVLLLVTGSAGHASTPIDEGFRGFSYPSGVGNGRPTGEKPESKLWFNDGIWWGILYDTAAGDFHIHRLNHATQAWEDTSTLVDDRTDSKSDALWDGTKLYVVSHLFTTTGGPATPSDRGRLYRFSYDGMTESYSLDTGFPVNVNDSEGETLVLAMDTTGTLWVTYVDSGEVMVNHSVGGDDTDWSSPPFALPFTEATNITTDDISSIIAYDGHVGVLWSNQTSFEMFFASHEDGDPVGDWNVTSSAATVVFDDADDHISLKALTADSAGKIFAAIKTMNDEIVLLVCTTSDCQSAGNWQSHEIHDDDRTRPIVVIDETNRELHAISTFCCPRDIRTTRTDLDSIDFDPPVEDVVIQESSSEHINDVTSFKGSMDAATGMALLASTCCGSTPRFYYHNYLDLVVATFVSIDSGIPGNSVTLTGAHFATATAVDFTGAPGATFTVVSDTQIDVTVPVGATTGVVTVTNSVGAASSSPIVFVLEVVPNVTGLSPEKGIEGASVTITGSGFTGTTDVDFDGTPAVSFNVVDDTQIDVTVPLGAQTGPVSVTNSAGTGISPVDFTVTLGVPALGVQSLPLVSLLLLAVGAWRLRATLGSR